MKPNVLIRKTVADAQSIDREQYEPRHGEWHLYEPSDDLCLFCLAGARMIQDLDAKRTLSYDPTFWEDEAQHGRESKYLTALDCLRTGLIRLAFNQLGYKDVDEKVENSILANHNEIIQHADFENWFEFDIFCDEMLEFADVLERYGY